MPFVQLLFSAPPFCSLPGFLEKVETGWFLLTPAACAPFPSYWSNKHIHQRAPLSLRLRNWLYSLSFVSETNPWVNSPTKDVPKAQRASISQWCGFAVGRMTLNGKGRLSWYCHNKSVWEKSYIPILSLTLQGLSLSVGQESVYSTL